MACFRLTNTKKTGLWKCIQPALSAADSWESHHHVGSGHSIDPSHTYLPWLAHSLIHITPPPSLHQARPVGGLPSEQMELNCPLFNPSCMARPWTSQPAPRPPHLRRTTTTKMCRDNPVEYERYVGKTYGLIKPPLQRLKYLKPRAPTAEPFRSWACADTFHLLELGE